MAFALFLQGRPAPVPPVDVARRVIEAQPDLLTALAQRRRWTVGSPAVVHERLEAIAAEYAADEVMVVTITHDHGARRRSYELLADEWGLNKESQAAAAQHA